ncbi:hypothetical protein [Thalassotalea castellviae]|uniref:Uncharacterized protein n=1 Tax=Thalassotalea castellviae TaxID=3075612 RepID=A0ABU2ZZS3_9GAMM|nr:hypothetical protein [Thalassotalea sp. W431]MDT0603427.1 hypothetical protein [Thalassotalea sp. W431]
MNVFLCFLLVVGIIGWLCSLPFGRIKKKYYPRYTSVRGHYRKGTGWISGHKRRISDGFKYVWIPHERKSKNLKAENNKSKATYQPVNEILPSSKVINRDEIFVQLIEMISTIHGEPKIISTVLCQLRIDVDGYAGDENRFFKVNEMGVIQLLQPNGDVLCNFNNLSEVKDWFIPKKDLEWEQALKKTFK